MEHNQGDTPKDVEFYQPRANEISQKFITDLLEEKERLGDEFPLCGLLIEEAMERIYSTGRIPGKEFYADVFKQKPLKVTQRVFLPVKQYPKFNFTGKILGPKGNSLRRLQDDTQCRIAIKGRNSIRDNDKEEELRNSGDPKFAHLNKDLFLEISTLATPAESYARVAYALAEVRKYIIPDKNDEVSQEQLREMIEINPESSKKIPGAQPKLYKSVLDRKMPNSNGAPKYLNLMKEMAYKHQMEEQEYEDSEEVEGFDPNVYMVKRKPVYEYKSRQNITTHKRPPPTMYATNFKRVRETQSTPNAYAVLKRYK